MTPGDEHFYAQLGDELEVEQRDKGTWTKALAQSDFDENKARAAYVEMRVEQLKAEARGRAEEVGREAKRRRESLRKSVVVQTEPRRSGNTKSGKPQQKRRGFQRSKRASSPAKSTHDPSVRVARSRP